MTSRASAIELMTEIKPMGAAMIELDVLRSPDKEEVTRIMFYTNRGYKHREWGRDSEYAKKTNSVIVIDGSYSSTLPDVQSRPPERGRCLYPLRGAYQTSCFCGP